MQIRFKKLLVFTMLSAAFVLAASACRGKNYVFYVDGKGTEDFYIVRPQSPTTEENSGAFKIRTLIEEQYDKEMSYYFKTDAPEEIVHKYEIIIGNTNRLKEEQYPVSKIEMGTTGYFIQVIENKVYICANAGEALREAVDYFIAEFIEGKDKIEIPGDYVYIKEAVFDIKGLYIDKTPISEYQLIYDDDDEGKEAADSLAQILLDKAGVLLVGQFVEDTEGIEKAIVISNASLPGRGFIKFSVEDGSLILSCSTEDGIIGGVNLFIETYLKDAEGSFNFPEGFIYSDIEGMIKLMPE